MRTHVAACDSSFPAPSITDQVDCVFLDSWPPFSGCAVDTAYLLLGRIHGSAAPPGISHKFLCCCEPPSASLARSSIGLVNEACPCGERPRQQPDKHEPCCAAISQLHCPL